MKRIGLIAAALLVLSTAPIAQVPCTPTSASRVGSGTHELLPADVVLELSLIHVFRIQ